MATNLKSISLVLLSLGGGSLYANSATAGTATNYAISMQADRTATCTGVVKDPSGEVLIGATITVKGSKNATVTDIDGKFSLSGINKGDVLVVSYLGFDPTEVKWNGQPLNITLKSDAQDIEEVVVVGYGVQKKSSIQQQWSHHSQS